MSAAALPILCRLFLNTHRDGRRYITNNLSTANITLAQLHTLARKGWITYEEHEMMSRMWGVKYWTTLLTERGRVELERVLKEYEARDAEGATETKRQNERNGT